MSRWLGRAGAAVVLASSGALIAPGCASNESSMYVRAALHVPPSTCEVLADPTAPALNNGVFDVTLAGSYSASLLIANQLVRRGDPDRLRTETSKVELYGADVTVLSNNNTTLTRSSGQAAKFFTAASGFADASSGVAPGLGIVSVTLIDPALAQDLAAEIASTNIQQDVVASVVVRGRTLGGLEVESWDWPFPIHVCAGCLCDRAPCQGDSATEPEANCRPGLDDMVDCRLSPTDACQ
jgi:hypothetical protein